MPAGGITGRPRQPSNHHPDEYGSIAHAPSRSFRPEACAFHSALGRCFVEFIALAPPGPVHRSREANDKAAHAERERGLVARFHEQVDVVGLDGEVYDAEGGV